MRLELLARRASVFVDLRESEARVRKAAFDLQTLARVERRREPFAIRRAYAVAHRDPLGMHQQVVTQ